MMSDFDTARVRTDQNGDPEARKRAWLVADSILRPDHIPAVIPRQVASPLAAPGQAGNGHAAPDQAAPGHAVPVQADPGQGDDERPREEASEAAPSLRQWLAVPVRVLVLAVLVIPTTTVAAFVVSSFRPPIYGASVDLLVNTREFGSEAETLRVLATQRVIVRSDPVLRTVAESTGEPLKHLRKSVSTEIVDDSEVLRITVADPSPEMAFRLVQAVTARYMEIAGLGEVPGALPAPAAPALERPSALPADLALPADGENAVIARAPVIARRGSSGTSVPLAQRATDAPSGPSIGTPDGVLRGSDPTRPRPQAEPPEIRILSPARVLDDPLEPKPVQSAVAGFLVGCLLAVGLVFVKRTIRLSASSG